MKILVSGSLAFDRIMDFSGRFKDHILPEKIHVLSVSFMVNRLREKFGGTAGNIAYSLSLLKETPIILATAGKDFQQYSDWLKKNNIDATYIKLVDDFTAAAHIFTDLDNNQITGFHPGAMKEASHVSIESIKSEADELFGIVVAGNLEDMTYYSKEYQRLNIPYIFDPAQQIPVLTADQLKFAIQGARIFIGNDYEIDLVLKKTNLTKQDILKKTELIVTTMGEQGSLIETKDKSINIPVAKPHEIKDPTGAGDAYRAGLIKGLLGNYSIEQTGRLAALSAVYPIECYGTQEHSYTSQEFIRRYKENFNESIKL
ncbi:carbohydrate kinase family protein [Patescibacteria group bacterium]|nr:carbohydrate kinase family protein [Patescibacteria group bacterium]MBU1890125.1 carbohydrate kinase family protein [Patescibacteria group bacterium]